jgi:hypothetical protein
MTIINQEVQDLQQKVEKLEVVLAATNAHIDVMHEIFLWSKPPGLEAQYDQANKIHKKIDAKVAAEIEKITEKFNK